MNTPEELERAISMLRGAYAAFNRGDIAAAVAPLDPDIEWREPPEFPGGGIYHGRAGASEYLSQSRAAWAEVHSEPEQFVPVGDLIVVFVHARVRAHGSDEWLEVRLADVYTFRDGRPVSMRAFANRDEALRWAQLRTFAQDGYVVLPQVVPSDLIDAARRAISERVKQEPPPPGHRGPHFYFVLKDGNELPAPLLAPLFESEAMALARSFMASAPFDPPDHVQISRNIPPWPHRPGGPHIEGLTPPEADGRPGTFTMLAGIFLTDQTREHAGNLWVWPGSHQGTASYLRAHGSDALLSCVPYPPIDLGPPQQVTGRAGDLLLAHYLLGHNMGGNVSDSVREVLYFRLRRAGHRERWREAVQDPLLEFESVRAALS